MTDTAINAVDYGFIPNGQDQTSALNNAIQAAIAAGKPLFIPPGTYLVGQALINGPLDMYGVAGKVTFQLVSGAANILYVSAANRARITGINFDGRNLAFGSGWTFPALVYIKRDQGANTLCQLVDCKVYNSMQNGVTYYGTGGVLAECEISACADAGVRSLDAENLVIRNNYVHDCPNNGILVWRSARGPDGTVVTGNTIKHIGAALGGDGPYGNAINVYRADSVIVSDNVAEDCEFSAVRANESSHCIIRGNACQNVREVALYYEATDAPGEVHGGILTNNTVEDCAQGIAVTNFDKGCRMTTITGNIIRRATLRDGHHGIGISVEADTVVTGNYVEDCERYGIMLGIGSYTRNVSAIGNTVVNLDGTITTDAGIGVSGASDAGYQDVAANMVQMKASPGVNYGLVALDWAGNIIMDGGVPRAVNPANFPKVTAGLNSIHL